MKNYRITVNGTSYDVSVEELAGGVAPVAAPVAAAPVAAPAAAPAPAAGAATTAAAAAGSIPYSSFKMSANSFTSFTVRLTNSSASFFKSAISIII